MTSVWGGGSWSEGVFLGRPPCVATHHPTNTASDCTGGSWAMDDCFTTTAAEIRARRSQAHATKYTLTTICRAPCNCNHARATAVHPSPAEPTAGGCPHKQTRRRCPHPPLCRARVDYHDCSPGRGGRPDRHDTLWDRQDSCRVLQLERADARLVRRETAASATHSQQALHSTRPGRRHLWRPLTHPTLTSNARPAPSQNARKA